MIYWVLFAEGLDDQLQYGLYAPGSGELLWVCELGVCFSASDTLGFIWSKSSEWMGKAIVAGSSWNITKIQI